MSSGTTWLRPRSTASARAVRQNAMVARGLAPYSISRAVSRGQVLLGLAGHADEAAGVLDERAVHVHGPDQVLDAPDVVGADHGRGPMVLLVQPGVHPRDDLDLFVDGRVLRRPP